MPATELKRRRLAALIIFCMILLVQGVYSFVSDVEPYPTVRMPSFGAAPSKDGLFPSEISTVTITYSDGSTVQPSVPELMEGFRFSAARTSMNFAFKPGKDVDPDIQKWLAARARSLHDGKDPKSVEFCWQDAAVDIHDAKVKNAKPCELREISL